MNAPAVILIAFATSAATATGTVYAIQRLHLFEEKATPKQPVPNLLNLTETDAKTNLETAGFKMMVQGRKATTEAAPGTVVEQVPIAGQIVELGMPVSVTFALEPPKVPSVIGKSVEDARAALEKAGFTVKMDEPVASEEHAEGLIVTQAPEADTALEEKGTVTLKASSGAASVEVPKLLGLGLSAAKAEAEKINLKLKVQWVDMAETASYVVLRQTPEPGESVDPSSEVTIVINR
jgi:serine/threonine-protein kinase